MPPNNDPSSKMTSSSPRGADVESPDEKDTGAIGLSNHGRDVELEKQKDAKSEEKGELSNAVTQIHHKGALDKHKFSTLGYQRRQQHMISDFATARRGNVRNRPALMQVILNQGVSDKAPTLQERFLMDALKATLESFPQPVLPDHKTAVRGGLAGLPLENNWTDIVQSHLTMNKSARHQQEALWELLHTELSYICKLTIVTDVAMAALTFLHQHGFLQEITHDCLFSNLPSVLNAHRCFWQEVMFPMLLEARRTRGPFSPLMLEGGFLQFRQHFSSYLQYCCEEDRIMEFGRRQMDTNPLFHTYVEWVESYPGCKRMRLGDMQAKPHMRITKYALLLKAVLKETQDPQSKYAVRKMLSSVNGFLDSINEELRVKDEEVALALSASRVEGYDVLEGISEEIEKHVRHLSHFDLTRPIRGAGTRDIRQLLLEETLKIREKREGKLEAVVLLFSDVLLVTKAQKKSEKLKVVRPPLALDRIACTSLKDDCSFVLVEVGELCCAVNIYTITTPSPQSRSEWVNTILAAQASLVAMRDREMAQRFGGFLQTEIQMETQVNPDFVEFFDKLSEDQDEHSTEAGQTLLSCANLQEERIGSQSETGTLLFSETEEGDISQSQLENWNIPLMGRSQFSQLSRTSVDGSFTTSSNINSQNSVSNVGSEREGNENQDSSQLEFKEIILQGSDERRVTRKHSKPRISSLGINHSDSNKTQSNANTSAMFTGESNVDTSPRQSEPKELQIKHDLESQHLSQEFRKKSWFSISEDDLLADTQKFSRNLNSPCLQKRSVLVPQHNFSTQAHIKGSLDLGTDLMTSNSNSSLDSDCNEKLRNSQRSDPQGVLSLASLKTNQELLWNMAASRESTGSAGLNIHGKPKLRPQRSTSVPDREILGRQDLVLSPSLSESSVFLGSQPKVEQKLHTFSLEDILKRAREREKGKQRSEKSARRKFIVLGSSLSPPLSLSEGERNTEGNLDFFGDQENKGQHKGFYYPDGASVDWPGWYFNDDDVVVRLVPESEPGTAQLSEVSSVADARRSKEQEEQEFGEV